MQLTASDIERIPLNFVVGKERSGTSLLQLMLNAHPNIVAPPESRFIILLYPKYGSVKQWSERNIRDFCNDLYKEGLFRNQWRLAKEEVEAALMPLRQHLTYTLLCKTIFCLFAPNGKEVKVLFDKNPVYYYFLPELEKLFPQAKFIHLVRDYRANIASHKRVFKIKKPGDLAYRWVKVNELIEEGKKRLPDRCLTLKYELLVEDPESNMKEVCRFLNLPYSESMGKGHTEAMYSSFAKNKREKFLNFHGSLMEPVNTSHIDEWKQKLLPEEIAEAEAVAGEYGKHLYGYEISADGRTKVGAIKYTLIKTRYSVIKRLYRIIFKRLWLYYFIKRKVWNNF